jgi:hypothetical protein
MNTALIGRRFALAVLLVAASLGAGFQHGHGPC